MVKIKVKCIRCGFVEEIDGHLKDGEDQPMCRICCSVMLPVRVIVSQRKGVLNGEEEKGI